MKRILMLILLAGLIDASLQAAQRRRPMKPLKPKAKMYNYYATFRNPKKLAARERALARHGEWQVPDLITHPDTRVHESTAEPGIVRTKINLVAATRLKSKDFTIKELPLEGGERVFKVCIETVMPGFDPKDPVESKHWGFEHAADIKKEGGAWCFTLKNGQGYVKEEIKH